MKKNEQLILSDVARLLNKKPYQIVYSIVSGQVPDVKLRLGGKRIFRPGDIQNLRRHFGIKEQKGEVCQQQIQNT